MPAVRNLRRLRRKRRSLRPSRGLVDRSNPLETFSPGEIFLRFRMFPDSIIFLVEMLGDALSTSTRRSNPIPPLLQVLATLRFFATGAFYHVISDTICMSASSVGLAVRAVTKELVKNMRKWVNFPDASRTSELKKGFFDLAGFPNVIGAIDCTHVRLQRPNENEADFVNRKGYHSLNVQMVCDARFTIMDCVSKWPGSVHDGRVFRESRLRAEIESGTYHGYLLGDSGYPLRRYLLTPFNIVNTPSEINYNRRHGKTRVVIEQSFGVLKSRFPCLRYGLRVNPEFACQIVIACVILHNIAIKRGDILKDFRVEYSDHPSQQMDDLNTQHQNSDGVQFRQFISRSLSTN